MMYVCSHGFENSHDHENINEGIGKDKKDERNVESKRRRNANRLGISLDNSNTYQSSTTRRYINIEDVSQIKNDAFYHKLLNKLVDEMKEMNICYECGNVVPYRLTSRYYNRDGNVDDNNEFFKVNDSYIWVDKTKLETDISLLSSIADKMHVIGYNVNENQRLGYKIAKAIAIYI